MNIKEKARAYDEAIKRAKEIISYYKEHNRGDEAAIEDIGVIFPELKQSEDEKIRKSLLCYFSNTNTKWFASAKREDIIKWLEKQGEKKVSYTTMVETGDGGINALVTVPFSVKKGEQNPSCSEEDKGEISDGYHTFNELYYYRMLYNAAFFSLLPKEWVHKSKRHHDGEECFGGGWFIVMAELPTGQISNHYELKDWDLFQIPEKEIADEWDGHTPQEAAERLHKYLQRKTTFKIDL